MLKYTMAVFAFKDNQIPAKMFEDGSIAWSLTCMANTYGKEVRHWLNNADTEELFQTIFDEKQARNSALAIDTGLAGDKFDNNCPYYGLVEVVKGSKEPGTWTRDRKVVLAFAAWLSPAFHSWMLDQILDLSDNGFVNLTKESQIGLKTNLLIEKINNQRYFGKDFKTLLNFINSDSKGHPTTYDDKLTKDTIVKLIRGIRRNTEYVNKNKIFKTLYSNFEDWAIENKKTCLYGNRELTLEFINNEHLTYRGKVIGQRDRYLD